MIEGDNPMTNYEHSFTDYPRHSNYHQNFFEYGKQIYRVSETSYDTEQPQSDANLPIIEVPDIGNAFEEVPSWGDRQLQSYEYSLDTFPNPNPITASNFSDLFMELEYPPKQRLPEDRARSTANSTQLFHLRKYPDIYSCVYMTAEEQAEVRRRQQRVNATTRERNRMRCLDQAFRNLAQFVPDLPRNRKASKQEILSGAIRHIGHLEKTLDIKMARKGNKNSQMKTK